MALMALPCLPLRGELIWAQGHAAARGTPAPTPGRRQRSTSSTMSRTCADARTSSLDCDFNPGGR